MIRVMISSEKKIYSDSEQQAARRPAGCSEV